MRELNKLCCRAEDPGYIAGWRGLWPDSWRLHLLLDGRCRIIIIDYLPCYTECNISCEVSQNVLLLATIVWSSNRSTPLTIPHDEYSQTPGGCSFSIILIIYHTIQHTTERTTPVLLMWRRKVLPLTTTFQ